LEFSQAISSFLSFPLYFHEAESTCHSFSNISFIRSRSFFFFPPFFLNHFSRFFSFFKRIIYFLLEEPLGVVDPDFVSLVWPLIAKVFAVFPFSLIPCLPFFSFFLLHTFAVSSFCSSGKRIFPVERGSRPFFLWSAPSCSHPQPLFPRKRVKPPSFPLRGNRKMVPFFSLKNT